MRSTTDKVVLLFKLPLLKCVQNILRLKLKMKFMDVCVAKEEETETEREGKSGSRTQCFRIQIRIFTEFIDLEVDSMNFVGGNE